MATIIPSRIANQQHFTGKEYRADIDGLRAVAVLSVVAFHAFPFQLEGGFVGVDVFFVISGFLISTIIFEGLDTRTFSFRNFYARRIKRIFPALIVVLSACYLFGWFNLLADEYSQLGKHIAAGAGFFPNFIFWREAGYFDNIGITKPLLHLWSLGIEEQFYIVWPLLLYLSWKKKLNLLLVSVVVAAVSFALNVVSVSVDTTAAFYSPVTRFWELLAGTLLAYASRRPVALLEQLKVRTDVLLVKVKYGLKLTNDESTRGDLQSIFGIFWIGVAVILIDKRNAFPGWWALLPVLGTCLIISAGPHAWFNRRVLSNRLLVWVGLISFPLYLWHYPLLSFAHILENQPPPIRIRIALVAISVALAWLTYRWIERPIRFGRKNTKIKVTALIVLMLSIGAVGYGTHKRSGFEFREIVKVNVAPPQPPVGSRVQQLRINCRREFAFKDAHYCLKDAAEKVTDVLLIGDSHAEAMYWGLAEYYRKIGRTVTVLGVGGCIGFFDTDNAPPSARTFCPDFSNRLLELALRSDSIKTIIHVARGPLYVTGKGFFKRAKTTDEDRLDLSLTYKNQAISFEKAFERGMRETLRRLVQSNKEIIFMIDTPELGFDVKECFGRRSFFITTKPRSPCAVSRSEFDDRNAKYWEITDAVLNEFRTVKVFRPSEYLCDEQWCWALKDNIVMYRDDDHLSLDGSIYIGERFASWISADRNHN